MTKNGEKFITKKAMEKIEKSGERPDGGNKRL